jgi:alanine dehydrogenase
LPYILSITQKGVEAAIAEDRALARAVGTHRGELIHLERLSPKKIVE